MPGLLDFLKDFQAIIKLGPLDITIEKQSDEGELNPEGKERFLRQHKSQLEEELRQINRELEGG